jgi:UDP-galactopyranose mutase
MPLHGFTKMFRSMLEHPTSQWNWASIGKDVKRGVTWDHLVFTGPGGRVSSAPLRQSCLPLAPVRARSLNQEWYQPVAVVNYPAPKCLYRITEYKY